TAQFGKPVKGSVPVRFAASAPRTPPRTPAFAPRTPPECEPCSPALPANCVAIAPSSPPLVATAAVETVVVTPSVGITVVPVVTVPEVPVETQLWFEAPFAAWTSTPPPPFPCAGCRQLVTLCGWLLPGPIRF